MSKSAWIHIIFDNACSTLGLWLEKIGGSENFLIFIPYLGPLVHSALAENSNTEHSWRWSLTLDIVVTLDLIQAVHKIVYRHLLSHVV